MSKNNRAVIDDNIVVTAAFTLASLLTAIAAICVSLLATSTNLQTQLVKLLFGFIGFLAISASALLVDWVFDEMIQKTFVERLSYLNFGYLAFSLVMGCIAFTTLEVTYLTITESLRVETSKQVLYASTAIFLWAKTLVKRDYNIFLGLLVVSAVFSFCTIVRAI